MSLASLDLPCSNLDLVPSHMFTSFEFDILTQLSMVDEQMLCALSIGVAAAAGGGEVSAAAAVILAIKCTRAGAVGGLPSSTFLCRGRGPKGFSVAAPPCCLRNLPQSTTRPWGSVQDSKRDTCTAVDGTLLPDCSFCDGVCRCRPNGLRQPAAMAAEATENDAV